MDSAAAAQAITTTADPAELFGAGPEPRARRRFRQLAAAVHPDRAEGISREDAERATALLLERWEARAQPAAPAPAPKPHLGGHVLDGLVHRGDRTSVYRIEGEPRRYATIARVPGVRIPARPLAADAPPYAPAEIERGEADGREWSIGEVPDGLVPLASLVPLDGRDWAWIARRILGALCASEAGHGELAPERVLVHPKHHGVVLLGWTGAGADGDLAALAGIFDAALPGTPDGNRQSDFATAAARAGIDAGRTLGEYDLLLEHLYGQRRFRPLAA